MKETIGWDLITLESYETDGWLEKDIIVFDDKQVNLEQLLKYIKLLEEDYEKSATEMHLSLDKLREKYL